VTARDRKIATWLSDFMEDQLGTIDHRPTIRRMEAAKRMLDRWLTADAQRRGVAVKAECGTCHGFGRICDGETGIWRRCLDCGGEG